MDPGLELDYAACTWLSPIGGLREPRCSSSAVMPTPFVSLRSLELLFHFVEPGALVTAAGDAGLTVTSRRTESLPAGKAFEVLRFVKRAV